MLDITQRIPTFVKLPAADPVLDQTVEQTLRLNSGRFRKTPIPGAGKTPSIGSSSFLRMFRSAAGDSVGWAVIEFAARIARPRE